MSEEKWTPGPWAFDDSTEDDLCIAVTDRHGEMEINARSIAAEMGLAWGTRMCPNLRVLLRVSLDDIEVIETNIFIPELVLNLQNGYRPMEDWYKESIEAEDFRDWIPEDVELYCDEHILFECVGFYSVEGHRDYWGEYDETTAFEMLDWAIAVDDC